MGGDEFTVLYRDVVDSRSIGVLVDRLCEAFTDPFHVAGESVRLGLSVGVALAGSHATADGMLAAADEALSDAKRAGGRHRAEASRVGKESVSTCISRGWQYP